MSKKKKWAFRFLRIGDAADAAMGIAPNVITTVGIFLTCLLMMGFDPMGCLLAYIVLAIAIAAVVAVYLIALFAIKALGFTEESLERECV